MNYNSNMKREKMKESKKRRYKLKEGALKELIENDGSQQKSGGDDNNPDSELLDASDTDETVDEGLGDANIARSDEDVLNE